MKAIGLCFLVLFGACADDDDGGGADPAVQGSCFYSCNTNFGTAYGCSSNAQITSSTTCDDAAEEQCGDSSSGQSEFSATCEACDAGCAPGWHNP